MNILYHHRTQASGAAGHHIEGMIGAFQKLGHLVDNLSPFGLNAIYKSKSDVPSRNRYLIPQFLFEIFEITYNVPAFFRLYRQLEKKRYNFIYERYSIFGIGGVLAAEIKGIPLILEVSFTSKTTVYPQRTKIFSKLAHYFDRFVFNRAVGIIVVSSVLKEQLEKEYKIRGEKILMLPNAVNLDEFKYIDTEGQHEWKKMTSTKDKIIGFVGGFYPWHGLDILLDAAEDVIKVCNNVRFNLIGDGPLAGFLKERVNKSLLK